VQNILKKHLVGKSPSTQEKNTLFSQGLNKILKSKSPKQQLHMNGQYELSST